MGCWIIRLNWKIPLYAEDLLRGYRLDVIDQYNNRNSLHRRLGQYKLLNVARYLEISDEGFIQPSVTSPPNTGIPLVNFLFTSPFSLGKAGVCQLPAPAKVLAVRLVRLIRANLIPCRRR